VRCELCGGCSGLRCLTSSRVWIPAEFWADCSCQCSLRRPTIDVLTILSADLRGCWLSQGRVAERHDVAVDLAEGAPGPKLPPAEKPLQLYTRPRPQLRLYSTVPAMSRASQITLATTCVTAIGTVAFVHWSQRNDKAVSTAERTWSRNYLTCIRQCIWASSGTSNSNELSANDRPTSRCRENSSRNTGNTRQCRMEAPLNHHRKHDDSPSRPCLLRKARRLIGIAPHQPCCPQIRSRSTRPTMCPGCATVEPRPRDRRIHSPTTIGGPSTARDAETPFACAVTTCRVARTNQQLYRRNCSQ